MEQQANKKIALITCVTGQDGAYLAEFLLGKGYIVHGFKRLSSMMNTNRIDHLYQETFLDNQNFILHYGDLTDVTAIIRLIKAIHPDEIYNLAPQSHVKVNFDMAEYTENTDGLGILRILDVVRLLKLNKKTRIYQTSVSAPDDVCAPQGLLNKEDSILYPSSPYAVGKLYPYRITVNYREAYDLYACNGILFNHERPFREETFLTKKITQAVVKIVLGLQNRVYLGNLSAERDWGHAKDYVEVMWLILQQEKPDDYVFAAGVITSVREFVRMSFAVLGVEILFSGKGEQEKGVIIDQDETRLEELGINPDLLKMGQTVVKVDTQYCRPTKVDLLGVDAKKVHEKLKWEPSYDLEMIVSEMVLNDLKIMQQEHSML